MFGKKKTDESSITTDTSTMTSLSATTSPTMPRRKVKAPIPVRQPIQPLQPVEPVQVTLKDPRPYMSRQNSFVKKQQQVMVQSQREKNMNALALQAEIMAIAGNGSIPEHPEPGKMSRKNTFTDKEIHAKVITRRGSALRRATMRRSRLPRRINTRFQSVDLKKIDNLADELKQGLRDRELLETKIKDLEKENKKIRSRVVEQIHKEQETLPIRTNLGKDPSTLEGTVSLKYQFTQAIDGERKRVAKLLEENRELAAKIKELEVELAKKINHSDPNREYINQIAYWRNESKKSLADKIKAEEHAEALVKKLDIEATANRKLQKEIEALKTRLYYAQNSMSHDIAFLENSPSTVELETSAPRNSRAKRPEWLKKRNQSESSPTSPTDEEPAKSPKPKRGFFGFGGGSSEQDIKSQDPLPEPANTPQRRPTKNGAQQKRQQSQEQEQQQQQQKPRPQQLKPLQQQQQQPADAEAPKPRPKKALPKLEQQQQEQPQQEQPLSPKVKRAEKVVAAEESKEVKPVLQRQKSQSEAPQPQQPQQQVEEKKPKLSRKDSDIEGKQQQQQQPQQQESKEVKVEVKRKDSQPRAPIQPTPPSEPDSDRMPMQRSPTEKSIKNKAQDQPQEQSPVTPTPTQESKEAKVGFRLRSRSETKDSDAAAQEQESGVKLLKTPKQPKSPVLEEEEQPTKSKSTEPVAATAAAAAAPKKVEQKSENKDSAAEPVAKRRPRLPSEPVAVESNESASPQSKSPLLSRKSTDKTNVEPIATTSDNNNSKSGEQPQQSRSRQGSVVKDEKALKALRTQLEYKTWIEEKPEEDAAAPAGAKSPKASRKPSVTLPELPQKQQVK